MKIKSEFCGKVTIVLLFHSVNTGSRSRTDHYKKKKVLLVHLASRLYLTKKLNSVCGAVPPLPLIHS
jgi:hypothetical protein